MDLMQIKVMLSDSGWLIVILLTLIQITPIKINPWSTLFKFVGRGLNSELNEKMDGFKGDLEGVKTDVARLSENVDSLSIRVDALQEKVDNLDAKIVTMDGNMTGLATKMDNLQHNVDQSEAKNARARILRFSDEILMGTKHSSEHFTEILQAIDEYERYCVSHPEFKNNMAIASIEEIKETYDNCRREHSFLFPKQRKDEEESEGKGK